MPVNVTNQINLVNKEFKMIVRIGENFLETEGCGCCSIEYSLIHAKNQYKNAVRENIIENIVMAKKACKLLNINFNDLLKDSKEE